MILKFETQGGGYVYHEVDEVITEKDRVNFKDVSGTCFCYCDYTVYPAAKIVRFRLVGGELKSAYFLVGYLLNNKGDTINML